MNNFIIISKTFSETTPESAEQGDFSDQGVLSEKENVSFSELVKLMKEHNQPSCSPNDGAIHTWYSTGFYTKDYRTGSDREECIHFHKDNTPNADKYWKLAARFAGLIK